MWACRRALRQASASVLLAGAAAGAQAQEPFPLGPEFTVSEPTAGRQRRPDVAVTPDGGFVVVWDAAEEAIFARRFDANGTPLAPAFKVNTDTGEYHYAARVAVDDQGRFAVAWQAAEYDDTLEGRGYNRVLVRSFAASGAALGADQAVSGDGARLPDVAARAGGFVVAWVAASYGGAIGPHPLKGRFLDPAGAWTDPEFPIATSTQTGRVRVTGGPGGDFVLTWGGGFASRVTARRYDATGAPAAPAFEVPTQTAPPGGRIDHGPADVAMDADGFTLTWATYEEQPSSSGSHISGRRYDPDGQPEGPDFRVTAETTIDGMSGVAVAADALGNFVVAWYGSRTGTLSDTWAQRGDAGGNRVGSPFRINTYTTEVQVRPAIARHPNGEFVVVWEDHRDEPRIPMRVQARRFGPDDLIFTDGFETGDVTAWTTASAGGGDLAVTPAAGPPGSAYALEATVDDRDGLYVQDERPVNERRYRARFWLDPSGFDPGEASGRLRAHVFLAFEEAPTKRLVLILLRRIGGQYALGAHVRRDDDTLAKAPFTLISAAPHVVELDWKRATAAGANDGTFELRVDGTPVAALNGMDNDARAIDLVRLGALTLKAGASGTLRFDEFASWRSPAPTAGP